MRRMRDGYKILIANLKDVIQGTPKSRWKGNFKLDPVWTVVLFWFRLGTGVEIL
jgi:hypothetical protein